MTPLDPRSVVAAFCAFCLLVFLLAYLGALRLP